MANEKQMNSRIQHKIDTAENWSKATGFTPLKGELIIYSDLKKFKVGDGDTNVNELPFYQAFDSIVEDENGIIHIGGYHDERYVENAGDLEVGSGTIHAGNLYIDGFIGSEAGYELSEMGLLLQAANGGHQHAFELDGIRLNGIHSETGDAHTYFSVTETVEDGEPDEGEDPSENRVYSHKLYLDGDAHFRGNVYVGDDTKRLLTEDDLQGIGGAIIDVIALPETDINESVFYRLLTAKVVANGEDLTQYRYLCYCVNGLPEVGLPATNADMSMLNAYYNIQDKVVYGYIDEALSAFLGIPVNWYELGMLISSVGQSWCGVITDISEDPMDGSACVLLTYEYYMYQEGWCKLPFACEKAPKVDIRWDGDMTDKAALDMSALGYNQGMYFVKVSDDVFATDELVGWSISVQYNDGTKQEVSISEDNIDLGAFPGALVINQLVVILYDADALATALSIPSGIYTNGVYFYLYVEDRYVSRLASPSRITRFDDKYFPLFAGEKVTGQKFTDANGSTVIAGAGAEIFNAYDDNVATGYCSHAEGNCTCAYGDYSHTEGCWTRAEAEYSHAEGGWTAASGFSAHAEGQFTTASGGYGSHAEGYNTTASNNASHAEGRDTTASGEYSHAEGYETTASYYCSHTEGDSTTASGSGSHAEGTHTIASNLSAHAEGTNTIAFGTQSHAEGLAYKEVASIALTGEANATTYTYSNGNIRVGDYFIIDNKPVVVTFVDITERTIVVSSTLSASAIVNKTFSNGRRGGLAFGNVSHAEGTSVAIGNSSHAEGEWTAASGYYSHSEGSQTIASNMAAHAEGTGTEANGDYSHAEGRVTRANGEASHAEGAWTTASGHSSHAEGRSTTASSNSSHTEGSFTRASSNDSHAEGYFTIANSQSQHVQGEYNIPDPDANPNDPSARGRYAHIVGNGRTNKLSNAHTLDWSGNAWFQGSVYVGGDNQDNAKRLLTEDDLSNVGGTTVQFITWEDDD